MRLEGTAILAPGQYRGAYQIGKQRGRYKALTQRTEVTVYRDPDKNETLDVQENRTETGFPVFESTAFQADGGTGVLRVACVGNIKPHLRR